MDNFNFYSPTFFAFGKDRENEIGQHVKRFGGSKVLIVYGGGIVIRSGLLDRVRASLGREAISCVLLGGVKPNSRSGSISGFVTLDRKDCTEIYRLMLSKRRGALINEVCVEK